MPSNKKPTVADVAEDLAALSASMQSSLTVMQMQIHELQDRVVQLGGNQVDAKHEQQQDIEVDRLRDRVEAVERTNADRESQLLEFRDYVSGLTGKSFE